MKIKKEDEYEGWRGGEAGEVGWGGGSEAHHVFSEIPG